MAGATAVGRVAEYLGAHTTNGNGRDTIALELSLGAKSGTVERHPLTVPDLHALLDIIAELCPAHESCEFCQAPLCIDCGVGDSASCTDHVHCERCWPRCGSCRHDVAREAEEERRRDAAWEASHA